jgi:DNA polymerase III sliding clamp (beta) subunit (PCNA family)
VTKVTFETATLADAVKRASRIAPSGRSNSSFDTAHGLLMEIDPSEYFPVVIRSTNLDVFLTEQVDVLTVEGEATSWRLSTQVFASFIGKLPIASGNTVSIENDGDRKVIIKSGRTKASFTLLDASSYPEWPVLDTSDLKSVGSLGALLNMVTWAAGKEVPFSGMHFDGEYLVATDRYKLVRVPCAVETLTEPVTIPAGILAPLVKEMGDTLVGVVDDHMVLQPNDTSQIKTVMFGEKYVNWKRIAREDIFTHSVMVDRDQFVSMISLVSDVASGDRQPALRMSIGEGEITLYMADVDGTEQINDVLEVPGQADHGLVEFLVGPELLAKALQAAPNSRVLLKYVIDSSKQLIHLDGGSGYMVWMQLRKDIIPQGDGA